MIRCKAVHDENGNSERSLYANPNLLIPHKLSNCEYLCDGCGARHYKEEATKDELKKVTRVYTSCCQKDKVTLPEMDEEAPKTPSLLIDLFTGESTRE
ncbi:hypothetical protein MJO28_016764 [Puccinia striiformis f. sp. tritici]|uniref:Uncharacterized protein n=1 Tax=Puccinia striiformis f. sp. tritici TaxID=168172 RepID=A0ACC0DRM3_9BASI|nr:hypothetical protein MJO28_016764 [Puccinia striiformis f. sp. tritici]